MSLVLTGKAMSRRSREKVYCQSRALRYIATSALLLGLIQSNAIAELLARPTASGANASTQAAIGEARERSARASFEPRMVQNTEPKTNSVTPEPDHAQSSSATNAFDSVCQTLQSAAQLNDLPLEFLTRLIWQESRFDAHAISPAGAQGIAQFMPRTAAWIGLVNPFDVADAITKSAELLRSLKSQFGNLGLAAAAYNAGPKRVTDWLAGHRGLPRETQAYVLIVTGHAAQEWTTAADRMSLNLPDGVPCPQIAKLFARDRLATPRTAVGRDNAKPVNGSATPEAPWGVQLIGGSSQISLLASYHQLQRKYQTVLGSQQPLVIRSQVGRNASWYRLRIATQTLAEAKLLCGTLREAGGSCLVQKN
jgi:soluble lytic murein transglycosylase-like protein